MVLHNREDCCAGRMNHFIITVGENIEGETNAVCVQDGGDVSKKTKIISNCDPPLQGRYVHVKLPNRGHITICEIQVYEGNLRFFLKLLSCNVFPQHIF